MNQSPELSHDETPPVPDPTNEPMPSPEDVKLSQALEEFLAAEEAGRRPNRRDFMRRYPEVAGRLAECLDGLEFVHAAAQDLDASAPETVAARSGSGMKGGALVGDYRIIREVGRGGMGIVYEAEQVSLGRRVALKVLPIVPALDPRRLQRFKNEAQAAAGLNHPNIVPVFAVGHDDGAHYYAMQFIEGHTLAAIIHELRRHAGWADNDLENGAATRVVDPASGQVTIDLSGPGFAADADTKAPMLAAGSTDGSHPNSAFFCTAARLALQAAQALDHAHQMGLVHRDVKPANLLVDARGHLWITDFGLALFRGDNGLTQSGALLGTLRYMSPEQALAKRGVVDHRTDIYSLGVTLYEFLTLKPAFQGTDRQELVRWVNQEEPRAPRRINPDIPPDLETIVLKAITKEVEGRYATAQELADDLSRFLADEPVRARRATLGQRLSRWLRRHPALVRSAAVLALMLIASLATCTWLVWKAQQKAEHHWKMAVFEWEIAQQQKIIAVEKSRLAEQKSELAYKAVEDMYARVVKWTAHMPCIEPLQQEFLRRALKLYERFAQENTADPKVRLQIAGAYGRIGDIHRSLGQGKEARQAWEQARVVTERLVADFPIEPSFRLEQANCYIAKGIFHLEDGRPSASLQALDRARTILEKLVKAPRADPNAWHQLAACYHERAMTLRTVGRFGEADRAFQKAAALFGQLVKAYPGNEEVVGPLAKVLNNRGNLMEYLGQPRHQGPAELALIVARSAALGTSGPTGSALLATVATPLGQREMEIALYRHEAEQMYRRAIDILDKLTANYPTFPDYQFDLAITRHNLGWLHNQLGKPALAEAEFRRALPRLERLVEAFPNIVNYRSTLGGLLHHWALLLVQRGDLSRARPMLERAVSLQQEAVKSSPRNQTYRERLGEAYALLAETLLRLGKHEPAARTGHKIAKSFRGDWQRLFVASKIFIRSTEAVRQDKRLSPGVRAALGDKYASEAKSFLRKAADQIQKDPEGQNTLAWFLVTAMNPRFRDAHQGRKLARLAVAGAPKRGNLWITLAVAEYRLGNWQAAIDGLEKAIKLRGAVGPTEAFFLAMCHWQQGRTKEAIRLYALAAKAVHFGRLDHQLRSIQTEAAELLRLGKAPEAESP